MCIYNNIYTNKKCIPQLNHTTPQYSYAPQLAPPALWI